MGSDGETGATFTAGQKVRLKADPSRLGMLTGETTEHRGRRRWKVEFLDGSGADFLPELAIEPAPQDGGDPFNLVRQARFSRVNALRSALTYYRLSGRLSDVIYSLNTTNTDFYPWQFKPVLSFLDSPSGGILIADEVGLGKTIEAGLIWTELRSRADARRLLVLCPAMLREKWRSELLEKFGVDARICNAEELLQHLERAAAERSVSFALIGSLQGLRPPAGWRDIEEDDRSPAARLAAFMQERAQDEPMLDLLVIDEAHYLRNPGTQTARLGRLLRPMTEGLVLMSATPVQMRSADLFHLLNLLDEDTFQQVGSFDEIIAENAPLIALRDRLMQAPMAPEDFAQQFQAALNTRTLSRSATLSRLAAQPPDPEDLVSASGRAALAEKIDRINPLSRIVCRTRKRDVQTRRIRRNVFAVRSAMSPDESKLYDQVTEQVRSYCEGLGVGEGFLLTIPQRQLCSSMPAAIRAWRKKVGERVPDDDPEVEEILREIVADLDALNPDGQPAGRKTVTPLLQELARIADEIGDFKSLREADTKFAALNRQLRGYWERYPGAKVVIFAYFKETLRYLSERLEEQGIPCVLLYGGLDKEAILRSFSDTRGPRVLLSSEVASEGIDLQFSSVVVNYDLPWNPMRIEQRIGRIDRLGQKSDVVLVWNLFYEGTLDDRVYTRLFERLKIFEQALGSTEAVLGETVREMTVDLLRHHLSPEEEAEVIERARVVVERNARVEEELERDAGRLIAHGAYIQLKIDSARELHRYITGQDLFAYVRDFFVGRYPGSQFVVEDPATMLVNTDLSPVARADLADFLRQRRLIGQTRLAAPELGHVECRFENRISGNRERVEIVGQIHPVVSFVTSSLREDDDARIAAACAAELDSMRVQGVAKGVYAFAVHRWSFSGEREVERLAYSAASFDATSGFVEPEAAERLVTEAGMAGQEWLNAPGEVDGDRAYELVHDCVEQLEDRFERFRLDMELENEDRIRLQLEVLRRHEEGRRHQLEGRIRQMQFEGKLKAARMFAAQLDKHRNRCNERRLVLEKRQDTRCAPRLVALGVVRVT